VPFRLESIDEADEVFLGRPPSVREVFISAFRELAAAGSPVLRGQGWYGEALHQRQRVAPGRLYSLHVGKLWRGAFFREGARFVFIGFGYRLPEFYDKLARLRKSVTKGGA
jgi:hypothetical protein